MCKKLIYVISFMLVLSLASNAMAVNWTDGGTNDLWSNADNWDSATYPTWEIIPVVIDGAYNVTCNVPDGGGRGFHVYGGAEVDIISGGYMRCRDGSYVGNTSSGTINVEVGGELAITGKILILGHGGWANVGTLNVNGGKFHGGHVWVGRTGTGIINYDSTDVGLGLRDIMIPQVGSAGNGTFNMNGGLVTNQTVSAISIGVASGSVGVLNLNGGLIQYPLLVMGSGTGTINCNGGTLEIDGNVVDTFKGYIGSGKIASTGTIDLSYDAGADVTTLTSIAHDFDPIPANWGSTPSITTEISWVLPDPCEAGDIVTCDVYFGTDPNVFNGTLYSDAGTSLTGLSLAAEEVYYWQVFVSATLNNDVNSPVFEFTTANVLPIADAGGDLKTWLALSPRTLDASGSSDVDGPDALTFQWTILTDANNLNPSTWVGASNIVNPQINLPETGTYTVELVAYDGKDYSDAVVKSITVYADACAHAKAMGVELEESDITEDCITDEGDLGLLAEEWLDDIRPPSPPNAL